MKQWHTCRGLLIRYGTRIISIMVNLESEEGQLDPKGYPGSNPGRGAIQIRGGRIGTAFS